MDTQIAGLEVSMAGHGRLRNSSHPYYVHDQTQGYL